MSATLESAAPHWHARLWRAAGWLLGSSMGSQALRLASSMVLTRLLLPEHFGMMAAVQTLYFGLVMFSDLGVWQSVVTHPQGDRPAFLGTAFCVQLARAAVLAIVVIVVALTLQAGARIGLFRPGTVFADPMLPWMVLAFSLCALLQGLESMHIATSQRQLQTRQISQLEILSQLAGVTVTLALAAITRSVWSLVAGSLVATLARTVLSHTLLNGPAYRCAWDRESARDIVGFGKWIFLSSVIGFAAAHGEKFLLGGVLDAPLFGKYAIAATLLAAVLGLVGTFNAHLVFPGLSEALREGPGPAKNMYQRMQRLADGLLGLLAGLLLALGPWVVRLLFDDRYAEAGHFLQLLALSLVAVRFQVLEQMMFARNQPKWVTASNALRACALAVSVPLGFTMHGGEGALIGVVASQFAGWPLALWFKYREGLLSASSELMWPLALAVGSLLGFLADWALRGLWH